MVASLSPTKRIRAREELFQWQLLSMITFENSYTDQY